MDKDTIRQASPVTIIVILMITIGVLLGLVMVRSVVNPEKHAQTAPSPLPTGEACRLQQAVCSVDPSDLPIGSQYRLKILANGTPILTGEVNQPTLALAQTEENIQYKCEIEVLNAHGTPFPEQSCVKTVDARYTCSNCTCQEWGKIVFVPAQKPRVADNDPAKYFQAQWIGATPPPECPDDAQNCHEVRVFAEEPQKPLFDNFISKYACTQNPAPTIRLHQAIGTGTRHYKAIPFDKDGNPLEACLADQTFSCADIGSCGLQEINYKAQYVERMDTGEEREVNVLGSKCDTRLCNFTLQQNEVDIEEDSQTCVKLDQQLDISYQSNVAGPKINYDDDRSGNFWFRLLNKTGLTHHVYKDAGVYEIKLNCDPLVLKVSSEFYCVKRLTIGCGGGEITPKVTQTPTPTPVNCPALNITMSLPSCTECLITPTP